MMKFFHFDIQHSVFIIRYFLGSGLLVYETRIKHKKIPFGTISKGNLLNNQNDKNLFVFTRYYRLVQQKQEFCRNTRNSEFYLSS